MTFTAEEKEEFKTEKGDIFLNGYKNNQELFDALIDAKFTEEQSKEPPTKEKAKEYLKHSKIAGIGVLFTLLFSCLWFLFFLFPATSNPMFQLFHLTAFGTYPLFYQLSYKMYFKKIKDRLG